MLKKAICERGHNIIMWTVIAMVIYKGEIKADLTKLKHILFNI